MKVRFKKFHPSAVVPSKHYNSDFCFDCVATSVQEISPCVYKYGLGFGLQAVRDESTAPDTRIAFDIRPRSSIYKTGMILSNSVGTVDENYTNEISVIFYHVFPHLPPYKVGDRVCQLTLNATADITFEEVDQLTTTDRGLNGFGSTGR